MKKIKSTPVHMGTNRQVRMGVWRAKCGVPAQPMALRWKQVTCKGCLAEKK